MPHEHPDETRPALLAALLTPFEARGRVDLARLRAHVLWLAAQKVDGFVPTAMPGEVLYLTEREREAIHRTVIDAAPGRSVYPCVWDPSPATMAFLIDAAREQGAAGVLVPPPLGYDLDERVVRAWFEAAAQKGAPVWLYHEPRWLLSPFSEGLLAELHRHSVVHGVADGQADPHRLARLSRLWPTFAANDRTLGCAAATPGLRGVVSTLANAWPAFCRRLLRTGDPQLEDALTERINRVNAAGGVRALKGLLKMPGRAPLIDVLATEFAALPAPEGP